MKKKSRSEHIDIEYQIIPSHPEAHIYSVICLINKPEPDGQILSLPAWIPGSYMIRDFSKNITSLKASSNNQPIEVIKTDKDSWKCAPCKSGLKIEYTIYAWDLSVRTAHLDTSHGFFNGTSVFLRVHNKENEPCKVTISKPAGEQYTDWKVATSMRRLDAPLHNFGTYWATDYDELTDHPVEMGLFSLVTFTVAGVPHDIVLTGQHKADMQRLCHDLEKICQTHITLFSSLPEINRYVFLVMVVGDGYGGLEHRASTSLLCSRDDLPLANQPEITEAYRGFLGLCSHEYFHTWNIKRIKPEVFLPYELSREAYTRQLWAFEGITSYYDDLGLVRSGLIDTSSYLELLGQVITRVWRGQGRFKQSVAESSFDAWTRFYKQDESAPNNIVSYYTKGSLIALALDLTIRRTTKNTASLDNVMQYLWQQYGKQLIGVPEGEIEKITSQIAHTDLRYFFDQYLYAHEDLPLKELLALVGIQFNLRQTNSVDDKGGKNTENHQKNDICYFGARITTSSHGAHLSQVFDNGPAQNAGLSAADTIIAVDGIKTDKGHFENYINNCTVHDEITLHVFRRDELKSFSVTLKSAPYDTCYLTEMEQSEPNVIKNKMNWLGIE
jgi:predicted metalloprotease with PDZ domain